MARLTILRGPETGKSYVLDQDTIQIGRGRKNDIIIHDNEVSREHCRLVRVKDSYELRDLSSSNGTFVNGQRVTEEGWLLKSTCIIEIGDSITLEFRPERTETRETKTTHLAHAYVVVKVKSQPEPEVFPLDGNTATVGRELTCEIVIQEPEVSRQHLRLRRSEEGFTAEDLGSTNGTLLNGQPLSEPVVLHMDDVLQLGSMVQLMYTDDPSKYLTAKTDQLPPLFDVDTTQRNVIEDSELMHRIKRPTDTSSDLGLGFEPGSLVGHVFMAYARSEWTSVVAALYANLQDRHLQVWVDQYLNRDMNEWEVALEHVLRECKLLVIVVSKAALDTDYVKRAWRYFHGREKPIILVMYEKSVTLPMELRNMTTIPYNRTNPTDTYDQLAAEIMRLGLGG